MKPIRSGSIVVALVTSCLLSCSSEKPSAAPPAVAAPTPASVSSAPAGACSDIACLIAAAKACQKATLTHTTKMTMMGMEQSTTTALAVEGREGQGCILVREVTALDLKLGDGAKELMRKQGASDADIIRQEAGALEALRAQGKTKQRCVMTPDALAAALDEEARGTYRSASWAGCVTPERACAHLPTLRTGCTAGACSGGSWPLTCTGTTGEALKCTFDSGMQVAEGSKVGCGEGGSISLSFGSP